MSKAQTVYIVDDEVTIREVVRRYLELEGFSVVEAEDGAQALSKLRQEPADLLLLDIMLPGLDGFTIARSVQNSPEYAGEHGGIPIIILTTSDDDRDVSACYKLGANTYIQKPVDFDGLIEAMKRLKGYWFEIAVLPKKEVSGQEKKSNATG